MSVTSQQEIQVLHVDDEPDLADLTTTFLKREDDRFTVETAHSADEGRERVDDRPPDCVVSDYNMPGMNGIEFLQAVREEYPNLPFILFTGKGSEAVASDAISAGVTDYLQKGSGSEQYELLANRIRNAVQARRETERADRQEQLMRLTEFAGDTGGFELDVDSGDLLLTDGTRRLVGLPDDTDLTLAEATELYHPDDQADVRRTINQAAEAGEQTRGTWRLQTLDGDQRLVDVTITPATENNDVTTLQGSVHDVTERRERRQELERRTDLFEKAQQIAGIGAWAHDIERGTLIWTDQVYEIHGISKDFDPSLDDVESLYHPEDQPKLREAHDQAVTAGEPYDLEVRMTARDDGIRWIRTVADPQTENSDVVRIRGTVHDITERKQREQKLELVETLFEHAEECQFIIDVADGEFELRHANDYYKQTVGLSPGEPVSGQTPTESFGEAGGQEILDRYTECVETRDSVTYTVEVPVPEDGTVYRTILTPVVTDDDVTHIVGTARDITDYKRREEKLNQQNNRLEEFTSVVSHDLRNPLRIADGKLELAQTECDSAHLNDVADAIDRSQALIEDLLTLAREGDDVSEVEPVVFADVAESSWQTVESPSATLETHATQVIQADQSRLKQLLENLYRNAVEHGGDDVTVSVGKMSGGFYVADTGPGIPEDDREELFEAGYSTNEEGTGFGLRIVEQVADAHGWEVTVTESEQGGARFEITGVEFADC